MQTSIRFGPLALAVVALMGSAMCLFTSERRAGRLDEAYQRGFPGIVLGDVEEVDPENEGELVLLVGEVQAAESLVDPLTGLDLPAVRLQRVVEMRNWIEDLDGDEPTYRLDWVETLVDSSRFRDSDGHRNPTEIVVPAEDFLAGAASLGAWRFPEQLLEKLEAWQPVVLHEQDLMLAEMAASTGREAVRSGRYLMLPSGRDDGLGDVRISYRAVTEAEIQVFGKQVGDTLTHFGTPTQPRYLILSQIGTPLFPKVRLARWQPLLVLRSVGLLLALLGVRLAAWALASRVGWLRSLLLAVAWSLLLASALWWPARASVSFGLLALALVALVPPVLAQRRDSASMIRSEDPA